MLTFDELKERIREREDPDTIIDMLNITIDDIVDSGCLDEQIHAMIDKLQEVYGGSVNFGDYYRRLYGRCKI